MLQSVYGWSPMSVLFVHFDPLFACFLRGCGISTSKNDGGQGIAQERALWDLVESGNLYHS